MVASKESFSSLQITDGPSIYMEGDTQIQDERKGSIKLQNGVFNNVLYVPSLATNLWYVYHMTHTGSQKSVVFDPDLVEILDISTGNLIAKDGANHASKAYEFSHFLPYSDLVHSQLPFEREGKFILPKHFAYDNDSINVSNSKS